MKTGFNPLGGTGALRKDTTAPGRYAIVSRRMERDGAGLGGVKRGRGEDRGGGPHL